MLLHLWERTCPSWWPGLWHPYNTPWALTIEEFHWHGRVSYALLTLPHSFPFQLPHLVFWGQNVYSSKNKPYFEMPHHLLKTTYVETDEFAPACTVIQGLPSLLNLWFSSHSLSPLLFPCATDIVPWYCFQPWPAPWTQTRCLLKKKRPTSFSYLDEQLERRKVLVQTWRKNTGQAQAAYPSE